MKAQDIYHKMRAIAEDYHAYTDQLAAIAMWIEAEFEYKPQKLANGANTSERQLTIPVVSSSAVRYTKKLDQDWDDDIYTVEEWIRAVKDGCFCNFDGIGYWVKDGLKSNDEVFSTPPLDATHVVWYNK